MKLFRCALELAWLACSLIVVFVILNKVRLTNDIHATIAQDPLENWVALAVAFILVKVTLEKRRDEP